MKTKDDSIPLQEYEPSLRRLARRLVSSSHDAEDVVQEVWLEALERPPRSYHRIFGWLRVATIHAAQRIKQRDRCRTHRENRVARPDQVPSDIDTIESESVRRYLEAQIEELAEPYRTVVRSKLVEEKSCSEIAFQTRRPTATIRSQYNRGLERLRIRLGEEPGAGRLTPRWLALGFLSWLGTPWRRFMAASTGVQLTWMVALLATLVLGTLTLFGPEQRGLTGDAALRPDRTSASAGVLFPSVGDSRVERPVAERRTAEMELAPVFSVSTEDTLAGEDLVEVVGRLSMRMGVGLPESRIYAAPIERPDEGVLMGISDDQGNFRIELPHPRFWVWAEVYKYAPTARHRIDSLVVDGVAEINLQTAQKMKRLFGSVRDAGGRAIPGASICIESADSKAPHMGAQRTLEISSPPVRALTDKDGGFDLRRHAAVRSRVVVTVPDHAPYVGYVTERGPGPIEFVLPKASSVTGRIMGSGGEALIGVPVQLVLPQPLAPRVDETDANGRFTFRHLPPGALELRVRHADEGLVRTLDVTPGRELFLPDQFLDRRATIHGRVMHASGPVRNVPVLLRARAMSAGPEDIRVQTDDEGEFAAAGLPREAYSVWVFGPKGDAMPLAWAHEVRPGGHPLLLEVDGSSWPSASLGGRILLEPGRRIPRLRVHGEHLPEVIAVRVDADTGEFRVGPLPPGPVEMQATLPSLGTWNVGSWKLMADQLLDAGELEIPRGGTLRVHVDLPADIPVAAVQMVLLGDGFQNVCWSTDPGRAIDVSSGFTRLTFRDLLPGEYHLILRSAKLSTAHVFARVQEGVTTEAEAVMGAGVRKLFYVQAPRQLEPDEELEVRVHSDAGVRTLVTESALVRDDPPCVLRFAEGLPPGRHRIEVRSSHGLEGRRILDVALRDIDHIFSIPLRQK